MFETSQQTKKYRNLLTQVAKIFLKKQNIRVSAFETIFSVPNPAPGVIGISQMLIIGVGSTTGIEVELVGRIHRQLVTHGSVSTPDLQVGDKSGTCQEGLFADPPACRNGWEHTVTGIHAEYRRTIPANRTTQVVLIAEVVVSPQELRNKGSGSIVIGES